MAGHFFAQARLSPSISCNRDWVTQHPTFQGGRFDVLGGHRRAGFYQPQRFGGRNVINDARLILVQLSYNPHSHCVKTLA